MSRILVVDDEASICWALREFLTDLGHDVDVAANAEDGLRLAESGRPEAIVLDVRLPGMDGLTALRAVRERLPATPVVVITAFGSLETAVRAMEQGAFDYLVKPFDLDQAGTVLQRALESRPPSAAARRIAADPARADGEALMGTSPAMQALYKNIALVAPTDVPVLITGESGTGKELVARAIHRHSPRRNGPFLPICLAALSPSLVERELFGHVRGAFTGAEHDQKGLLELASGGTVLLDEVGDIPLALQVKLLRAIEHRESTPVGDARPRPTNIRVIAATHRPLDDLMAAGQFRDDLYYRLSVFRIHLPPLRDRREDIPELAAHFLRHTRLAAGAEGELSAETIRALRARPWVGNIRELRNAIEHAAIVARGGSIRPEHLPAATAGTAGASPVLGDEIRQQVARWAEQAERLPAGGDPAEPLLYDRFLELVEPPLLRVVLEQCRGNRAVAAQKLGIHRATLRQRLGKYGIS
jgi:two-component system nitrogen regulation response regulator GlnG